MAEGHEGEILAYRELCDLLKLEFKRGKGKELQLQFVSQYLALDRETIPRKIVIQKVYSENEYQIVGGKGKTFSFIKNKLLQRLQTEGGISETYSELFEHLGLAKKHYIDAAFKTKELLPRFDQKIKDKFQNEIDSSYITEQNLFNFLQLTKVILKEIIRSSLRQMVDKNLINYTNSIRPMRHKYIDDDRTITEKHTLTYEEQLRFEAIEAEVIEAFDLKGRQQLYYRSTKNKKAKKAQEVYANKVDSFVRNLGYSFYATVFIITITPTGQQTEIDPRFLNTKLLQQKVLEMIRGEKELEKVIPQGLLEKFIVSFLMFTIITYIIL